MDTKGTDVGEEVRKGVQKMGQMASDLAKESLSHLRDNATEYYQKGIDKAGDLEKRFEQKVNTHPLAALAIAACFGLVVGTLWKKS